MAIRISVALKCGKLAFAVRFNEIDQRFNLFGRSGECWGLFLCAVATGLARNWIIRWLSRHFAGVFWDNCHVFVNPLIIRLESSRKKPRLFSRNYTLHNWFFQTTQSNKKPSIWTRKSHRSNQYLLQISIEQSCALKPLSRFK